MGGAGDEPAALAEFGLAWFRRCPDKTQDGNDAVSLVTKRGQHRRTGGQHWKLGGGDQVHVTNVVVALAIAQHTIPGDDEALQLLATPAQAHHQQAHQCH